MMNKKYIIAAVAVLCFALQTTAQSVMVEKAGRAAKTYYSPEMGVTIDFNMGYTLGLGDAHNYANSTPLPSYHIGVGYAFNERWKIALSYQNANLQQDMGPKTLYPGDFVGVYGHAVRNMDFNNILVGGEYTFPVSRWVRPYVALSVGMGNVSMYTDVAAQYTFKDSKWLFAVAPEAGLRGFFDKNMTVGYRATVSYNQYFGSLKVADAEVSSPSYLRIGVGAFVKFF